MKKDSRSEPQSPEQRKRQGDRSTIGMDVGDKASRYCMLNEQGDIVTEGAVGTTRAAITANFAGLEPCRMALEVGTHSPWISRLLRQLGHEVVVANARKLQVISQSSRKDDRMDARTLARLARVDPELLSPIPRPIGSGPAGGAAPTSGSPVP